MDLRLERGIEDLGSLEQPSDDFGMRCGGVGGFARIGREIVKGGFGPETVLFRKQAGLVIEPEAGDALAGRSVIGTMSFHWSSRTAWSWGPK